MDPTFDLPHSPSTTFPQARQEALASKTRSNRLDLSSIASLDVATPPIGSAAASSLSSGQLNALLATEDARYCCSACPAQQPARQAGSSPATSQSTCTAAAPCPVDSPADAHFMAMTAKLIYEDPRVIADCLEHRCCC